MSSELDHVPAAGDGVGYVPEVHLPDAPAQPEPPQEAEHTEIDDTIPSPDAPAQPSAQEEGTATEQPGPAPEEAPEPSKSKEPTAEEPPAEKPEDDAPEKPEPEPTEEPEQPKKPKRNKLFIALTCLFAGLALCAIGGISYVYLVIKPYESYDKIMPNVYCAGVNLGGMTVDEAADAIEAALADRKSTRLNSSHVRTSRMPSSA